MRLVIWDDIAPIITSLYKTRNTVEQLCYSYWRFSEILSPQPSTGLLTTRLELSMHFLLLKQTEPPTSYAKYSKGGYSMLKWCHISVTDVFYHQQFNGLFNSLLRLTTKKVWMLHIAGPYHRWPLETYGRHGQNQFVFTSECRIKWIFACLCRLRWWFHMLWPQIATRAGGD